MGAEAAYALNTLFLLFSGALVMLMALGFAMLEAGMVRAKSVATILVKNIGLYAVAGLMFWLVGYNLMYRGVGDIGMGWFGVPGPWKPDESAALAGDFSAGYSSAAFWFFQMVFVATTASICSGALAERIKIGPFFVFTALLTGVLYPITGAWVWGGGWLAELGFKDFAGSTLVHAVGGWAALTGAILLGSRRGRFDDAGGSHPIPGASLAQATLGTFILWFGWFGFNGGSQLAIASAADAMAVAEIFVTTNLSAAGGAVAVGIVYRLLTSKIDVPMALNGALAGLVSITAEPATAMPWEAVLIGAVGGLIMMAATWALEKAKIDDVVGAIPVHLAAGIWGTLAVPLTNPEANFGIQIVGIIAIGGFAAVTSFAAWSAMRSTTGIRLHWSAEDQGGDMAELGVRAYNLGYEEPPSSAKV